MSRLKLLKRASEWIIEGGSTLSGKIIHGGFWATLLNFGARGLQLLKFLILANYLSPNDFGIFGMAILLITIPNILTDLGFDDALIDKQQDNIDEFLDIIWTIRTVKGLLIALSLWLIAPFISNVVAMPELTAVIPVGALALLATNSTNPGVIYFEKNIEFRDKFNFEIIGTVMGFFIAILVGVIYQSYWALVIGYLSERSVRFFTSFVFHPYRPSLSFDLQRGKELYKFGRWIQMNRYVTIASTKGDDLFIGWYLGATPLGYYQLAFRMANLAATEIAHVVGDVMFPAFSKLRSRDQKLRSAFVRTNAVSSIFAFPMAAGTFLIAPSFVAVLLGPNWSPMIPVIQVLSISAFIRTIVASGGVLFRGVGKPAWEVRSNLARVVTIAITILPLTTWYGVTGAAVSVSLGLFAMLPIWFIKSSEFANLHFNDYIKMLLPATAGCIGMAPPVLHLLTDTWYGLISAISAGVISYILIVLIISYTTGLYQEFMSYLRVVQSAEP